MKTRQQRLAQERAGHPPSPPQQLADNPRGSRRTRTRKPSAREEPISSENAKDPKSETSPSFPAPVAGNGQNPHSVPNQPCIVAAGFSISAAQSAVPGGAQALLLVWVDAGPEASGRSFDNLTIQVAIPSSFVPQLLDFIIKKRNFGGEDLLTNSSASTQVTPSFDRRQFAHQVGIIPSLPPTRTGPQLQETPGQMAPHIPPLHAEPPSQVTPQPMSPHTPPARAEPPLQETFRPITPYTTTACVQSPLNETSRPRPVTPQTAPPARIEQNPQQTPNSVQSSCIDQPLHTMSQGLGPVHAVHQAVASSCRDLVNKQALDQDMPEQEFGEPIKSKQMEPVRHILSPSQSQTANGSTRRKRRVFSRKPLLPLPMDLESQPVPSSPETLTAVGIPAIFRNKQHLPTYTPDGTALYGNLQLTAIAPATNAFPKNYQMSQKLDDEAAATEDFDMNDVSESGSTTGHLAESSLQEATQSTQERTPEAPRGSRWGLSSLIESALSVTRRFGFSPLTPVSEPPEFTIQAQTMKRNSLQASVRAKRVKTRRHDGSVAKPAKTITTGANQRGQQSRAKIAYPASGSTEAAATEAEQSPTTRRIHRDQEESRRAQSGESQIVATIRFPSRSLDRMAIKRKRWGSPDTIPNPKGKSYGLGEEEFYGNSEELEKDGVTEQQPGKLRRTSELGDFSSQIAGNPHKARPYTGSMFEKSATEYNGGNVFSEYEAARKAEEAAAKLTSAGRQSAAKTPIPVTNSAGTFKVPSPGDSDWSDSESDGEVYTEGLEDVTPTADKDGELEAARPALLPSKLPKPQQIVKPKKSYLDSLLNPPSSRVADHSLLERPLEGATAESEALRKARDRALQHKPRNPSTLSQSSRTYSSPPVLNEEETKTKKCKSGTQAAAEPSTISNPGPTGHLKFNAYEEWCKTASPAVTAALGRMKVDPNLAGNAFSGALENPEPTPNSRPKFNAFEEWSKKAPQAVVAAIARMEVDSSFAGDAFLGALENFTASGKRAGQEAAGQSTTVAPSDTLGSNLPSLRPFTPLTQYGISQRVEDYLNSQWDEEDEQAAITGFRKAFQIFQQTESATVAVATAGLVA